VRIRRGHHRRTLTSRSGKPFIVKEKKIYKTKKKLLLSAVMTSKSRLNGKEAILLVVW
jgi:hypothetical protein